MRFKEIYMSNIKVSIIVPVYNGEKWLNRCLRSLVNQTLKELQIICVNDCSSDNSLVILQEYAKKDKRITIKNLKKNGGESVARNNGLKIAKGEYIAFVDQDDYIDLNFYEKLYERTRNGNIDIVKGDVKRYDKRIETTFDLNSKIIENKFYFHTHWWTAIYKASFLRINNIRLREDIIMGADHIFLVKAVANANKVMIVNDTFYYQIKRMNSGCSKVFNCKKMNSEFKTRFYIFDYLNKIKISKNNYIIMYKIYFLYFLTCFNKSEAQRNKEFVCDCAMKLYEMCKYKNFLDVNEDILYCLNNNDKDKLFTLLTSLPDITYPTVKLNIQKKYIYVWGKGRDSESVVWQCKKNKWEITNFLDSSRMAGTVSPAKILEKKTKNYFIIISSRKYCDEIAETCENSGLKEGLDFWKPIN